jgi:hypothetical protein
LTIVSEPVIRISGLEDPAEHAMEHVSRPAARRLSVRAAANNGWLKPGPRGIEAACGISRSDRRDSGRLSNADLIYRLPEDHSGASMAGTAIALLGKWEAQGVGRSN